MSVQNPLGECSDCFLQSVEFLWQQVQRDNIHSVEII